MILRCAQITLDWIRCAEPERAGLTVVVVFTGISDLNRCNVSRLGTLLMLCRKSCLFFRPSALDGTSEM